MRLPSYSPFLSRILKDGVVTIRNQWLLYRSWDKWSLLNNIPFSNADLTGILQKGYRDSLSQRGKVRFDFHREQTPSTRSLTQRELSNAAGIYFEGCWLHGGRQEISACAVHYAFHGHRNWCTSILEDASDFSRKPSAQSKTIHLAPDAFSFQMNFKRLKWLRY